MWAAVGHWLREVIGTNHFMSDKVSSPNSDHKSDTSPYWYSYKYTNDVLYQYRSKYVHPADNRWKQCYQNGWARQILEHSFREWFVMCTSGAEINVHPLISLLKSAHYIKILINHGILFSVFCISKIWHAWARMTSSQCSSRLSPQTLSHSDSFVSFAVVK